MNISNSSINGTMQILSGFIASDDLEGGIKPLHLVGIAFAAASNLCSTIGILIQVCPPPFAPCDGFRAWYDPTRVSLPLP